MTSSGSHEDSAFGAINSIHPITTTVVFTVTVLLILSFEAVLNRLYIWASRSQQVAIFLKFQRQIAIFGIASFCLFVLDVFSVKSRLLENMLPVMNFVHIILVAVTITFGIQTFCLVPVSYLCHTFVDFHILFI